MRLLLGQSTRSFNTQPPVGRLFSNIARIFRVLPFQHTAARVAAGKIFAERFFRHQFQHTAARGAAGMWKSATAQAMRVSTHSRPWGG